MTSEEAATVKVGDRVVIGDMIGSVKQTTPSWFMVTWDGGGPEIIQRIAHPQMWILDA